MNVAYITNAGPYSGVGNRAHNIKRRVARLDDVKFQEVLIDGEKGVLNINGLEIVRLKTWPGIFNAKSINWVRLGRQVLMQTDVYHLTNQSLSFLAKRLSPTVVTVHDLIELTDPQDVRAKLLNRYLYSGIARTDHIITVSEYSAAQVKDYFGLAEEQVSVIRNGVDREIYYQVDNFLVSEARRHCLKELNISEGSKVILYVGSDHPRKNVLGAVEVVSRVREKLPNLVFVKVGVPGFSAERLRLTTRLEKLKLINETRFVSGVSEQRLNDLYNLADVLLYPSRHEGFGLPPLQAMAAGLPVVTSNTTAIPEVVGKAAATFNPDDIDGMAEAVRHVLEDEDYAKQWRERGLERAKLFAWDKAAAQVAQVYKGFE